MVEKKFDPKKLEKLNNPKRLIDIPPDYIWGKLNMEEPDVLVEIGAGTAFFSIAFLEHFKPSALYACDSSEIMINWVKENVTPKHPNIIPVKTQEDSVPLDVKIADLVFTINLHHELDKPYRIVEESYRLLKPGGEMFIVDWKKNDIPEGPPQEIRWSPEQVKDQLLKAGFSGVDSFDELPKHFLVIGKKNRQGIS